MYIKRYIENTIRQVNRSFKVLYLDGPRQSGKTTMLMNIAQQIGLRYITLDDPELRIAAKQDPSLFLQQYPTPLFIDEAQYAPELFSYIKIRVDQAQKNGLYWLSGSQHFPMIRGLQESLAGRVGIVSLQGLSLAEEHGWPFIAEVFLPQRRQGGCHIFQAPAIFALIFRGSFPALVTGEATDRERFYASYIQTYLDRDVVGLFGVEKTKEFHKVLSLLAARTGQMLQLSEIAKTASVTVSTVSDWLSILEASGLVFLLQPHVPNISKRIIRRPKLYMLDTGLAAYLTKWKDPETLAHGAMAGALFETFAVAEVIKSYLFRGEEPPVSYYRDKQGNEVDLLLERDGVLYPIEIKMAARVRQEDLKGIHYLRRIWAGQKWPIIGPGGVICLAERRFPIDRQDEMIPVSCIS